MHALPCSLLQHSFLKGLPESPINVIFNGLFCKGQVETLAATSLNDTETTLSLQANMLQARKATATSAC